MAKIRVMSDLHLEFGGKFDLEPIDEDLLILGGDIDLYHDGIVWARSYARRHNVPVVMIAGNHEFYRTGKHLSHTVQSTLSALRDIAYSDDLLTFLENDTVEICGVTIAGCTLWTDFALNGENDRRRAMHDAYESMNDYRLIKNYTSEQLTPQRVRGWHERSVKFLKALPRADIIITHHLPSALSIAGRYQDSIYNSAYASNLDGLVTQKGAALWVHGHTHVSQDYQIGSTRVVCNPRGYYPYELNPDFNPDMLIDVNKAPKSEPA